jgi:predicted ATPase
MSHDPKATSKATFLPGGKPVAGDKGLPAAGQPLQAARWQLQLLGQVKASAGALVIDRFPSRAVATLLARLALWPARTHAREELIELLWPGVDLTVGRNRLRQALSTLRSLLEPAGLGLGAVIVADRLALRLAPGALTCDAEQFDALCRTQPARALALYAGELMPGFYDEWILEERARLAGLWGRLQDTGHQDTPAGTLSAPANTTQDDPNHHTGLAPAARVQGPLPLYLTRFFGAEEACSALEEAVSAHRLVTLLGPGGSGKTRLVVRVAARLCGRFERVVFVPLVSSHTVLQALDTLALALGIPPAAALDEDAALARIVEVLQAQKVCLLLDNFEQLVDLAQPMVTHLLSRLPGLHVLVTSRKPLRLDGEHQLQMPALTTPAMPLSPLPADTSVLQQTPQEPLLADTAQSPAVSLFVDRARAVRADFHLTQRNHAAVGELVHLLRGMPLAIELAASRVRSFPPAELLSLLSAPGGTQLALLARAGPRSAQDTRHASMSAVIDWSWRLLDEGAKAALALMTVFPADCHAAALAAALNQPLAQTSATLDDLMAQSLVRVSAPPAEASAPLDETTGRDTPTRFGLLEPVREYAAAQAAPEALRAARARLRRWFAQTAQTLGNARLPPWVAPELATVYGLIVTASADADSAAALDLALALRSYWDTDAMPGRLQASLEQALGEVAAAGAAPASLVANSHELLAYLRFESGFVDAARVHAQAALAAAPAGSDPAARARALVRSAWVHLAAVRGAHDQREGAPAVQAALAEALHLARAAGDRDVQARALHQQAVLASHVHQDPERAEALLAASQSLWLALGDHRKAHARLRNRAQCWVQMGRVDEAKETFEQCARAARDDGDWVGQIDSELSLSTLLGNQRQWQQALEANRRCVALCWQRWHRHGLAYALWNPARLLARLRQPHAAMRLMGFAATYWVQNFGALGKDDELYVKRVRALVQAQLGKAASQRLWDEGLAMDMPTAVNLAMTA